MMFVNFVKYVQPIPQSFFHFISIFFSIENTCTIGAKDILPLYNSFTTPIVNGSIISETFGISEKFRVTTYDSGEINLQKSYSIYKWNPTPRKTLNIAKK